MAALSAFCRTRVALNAKSNVDDALKKWWAKYTPDEGQVRKSCRSNICLAVDRFRFNLVYHSICDICRFLTLWYFLHLDYSPSITYGNSSSGTMDQDLPN